MKRVSPDILKQIFEITAKEGTALKLTSYQFYNIYHDMHLYIHSPRLSGGTLRELFVDVKKKLLGGSVY